MCIAHVHMSVSSSHQVGAKDGVQVFKLDSTFTHKSSHWLVFFFWDRVSYCTWSSTIWLTRELRDPSSPLLSTEVTGMAATHNFNMGAEYPDSGPPVCEQTLY